MLNEIICALYIIIGWLMSIKIFHIDVNFHSDSYWKCVALGAIYMMFWPLMVIILISELD